MQIAVRSGHSRSCPVVNVGSCVGLLVLRLLSGRLAVVVAFVAQLDIVTVAEGLTVSVRSICDSPWSKPQGPPSIWLREARRLRSAGRSKMVLASRLAMPRNLF